MLENQNLTGELFVGIICIDTIRASVYTLPLCKDDPPCSTCSSHLEVDGAVAARNGLLHLITEEVKEANSP